MYERCLDEAERILASDRDVIVAVKKLWSEVTATAQQQGFEVPTFPDFSAMLEGDPRFEFLPFHKTVTEDLEDPVTEDDRADGDESEDDVEMEQLGFFSGDRVKLRSVKLGPQLLGTIIRSKVDRTMNALTKAWEARPEGDRETEDRLLEILAKTQKLQREVKKTFSTERMERLEKSLSKSSKSGKRSKPTKRKASPRTVAPKTPARKVRKPRKIKTGRR